MDDVDIESARKYAKRIFQTFSSGAFTPADPATAMARTRAFRFLEQAASAAIAGRPVPAEALQYLRGLAHCTSVGDDICGFCHALNITL